MPTQSTPKRPGPKPIPIADRFWQYVNKTDDCWLWKGATTGAGYGLIGGDSRDHLTHRYAFEIAYGSIPDGMMVLHTCDCRNCIRNDDEGWYEINGILRPRRGHLWLGTHIDNMADMAAKGRAATGERHSSQTHPEVIRRGDNHPARLHPERMSHGDDHYSRQHPEFLAHGEENGNAALTADLVREIRTRYAQIGVTQRIVAEEFNISQGTVWQIVTRRTWRHVD